MGRIKIKCLVFLLGLSCVLSAPAEDVTSESSMVVVTDDSSSQTPTPLLMSTSEDKTETKEKDSSKPEPPKIKEMTIHSNITNRFAHTVVKSRIQNPSTIAQEVTFFVVIPEKAYISHFIMEIGGKNYTAYVQEKEQAKQTYDEAVQAGYGAAHVAVSARDSNKFTVSTNIEPESKAIFYLTYEELLERTDGKYEHVINIHPKQLVKNLNVQVEIDETRPLTFVKAPPIRSGNEIGKESEKLDPRATITKPSENKAVVKFSPDYEQQKQIAQGLGTNEEEGIGGQFIVEYDVERDPHGGEVLIKDGYFVHFFAPSELKPLDKHIVFVLDSSGSMYGRSMEQLKIAMRNILGELNPKDSFNIVEFNTNVKVWNLDAPSESTYFPNEENSWYRADESGDLNSVSFPPAYPVTNSTIKKADKAVDGLEATGGTNIFEALRVGIHLIKLRQERTGDKNLQPLIVFLTDGDPTVGRTDTNSITSGISEENTIRAPIVSLSFGNGADRKFMQKISLNNFGFARHIYEDSDASLQLEDFYKEISSPLLNKVKFMYTPDTTSLTRTEFPILFMGSECVVAGQIPDKEEFKEAPKVEAWGITGPIILRPKVVKTTGQLERLWAYLTIKKYLDASEISDNSTVYKKKALDLALKYSFVTDVTSLVVVKPNSTKAVDAVAADQGPQGIPAFAGSYYSGPGLSLSGAAGFGGGAYPSSPSFGAGLSVPSGAKRRLRIKTAAARPISVQNSAIQATSLLLPPPTTYFAPIAPSYPLPMPMHPITTKVGNANKVVGGYSSVDDEQDADFMISSSLESTDTDKLMTETLLISSTTTTTTTEKPVTLPPDFANKLKWLTEQLNPNGSLKFLKGNYMLGFNSTSPTDQECTTPTSEEGNCVLIKDCSQLYNKLIDTLSFKNHFCSIDGKFAGVCCPKKKPETP